MSTDGPFVRCFWFGIDWGCIAENLQAQDAWQRLGEVCHSYIELREFSLAFPDPPDGFINLAFLRDCNHLLTSDRCFSPCRFSGARGFDGKTVPVVIRDQSHADVKVLRQSILQGIAWAERAAKGLTNGSAPWGEGRSAVRRVRKPRWVVRGNKLYFGGHQIGGPRQKVRSLR